MNIYLYFTRLIKNIRQEHIGAFAAQASFFLILSFFPMVFLCLTVLGFSKNGTEYFSNLVTNIAPFIEKSMIASIINDYGINKTSVISFSTLLTAWSAGKGFYALSDGFCTILGINETRNYIILRIRGLLYSVIFASVIALLFIIGVFGGSIQKIIFSLYPDYFDYFDVFSTIRTIFVLVVLFVILSLIYIFLPDWKTYKERTNTCIKHRYHFICAIVSSIFIYLYTAIFSLYVNVCTAYNHIYGGINAFISVMLWIYGSMYILILGFRLSVHLSKKRNYK